MTFDEFVEFERTSNVKHEIWDGVLVAMAGAKEEHNDVAGNVFGSLHNAYRAGGCKPYGSDQMVHAASLDKGFYPDVSAVCGPREFRDPEDRRVLLNPTLVVEVLSQSTASRDMTQKLDAYLSMPSVEQCVIIDPSTLYVRVYTRRPTGWLMQTLTDADDTLDLTSVNAKLTMAEIYFGVTVGETSTVRETDIGESLDELTSS